MYGTILSCVLLPDTVGVGASGALLGNLSAWLTWIIFRWRKIPEECRSQRNCQLVVVSVALGITLATSFAEYVDYAAHFGGAIHGFLWALVLVSHELDNESTKWTVRIFGILLLLLSWVVTTWYFMTKVKPTEEYLDTWAQNDDWSF